MSARIALFAAAAIAALALAACAAGPVDRITNNDATLHISNVTSSDCGASGTWQYQLRNVSANGNFYNVGPVHSTSCSQPDPAFEVRDGLQAGTRYALRLQFVASSGQVVYLDKDGTQNGNNYGFTTKTDSDQAVFCEQNEGAYGCEGFATNVSSADSSTVTTECDNGATACASAAQQKCKGKNGNPLTNRFTRDNYFKEAYGGKTDHVWCWKNGKITSRQTTPDMWVTNWGKLLGDWVNTGESGFKYSECTSDMSSCLTRYLAVHSCCFLREPHVSFNHCIATRICAYACGPTGAYHSRNIINGRCPS